ncbi:MAG TPA: alpha/beta hydrolase [Euzebyales bacterium]|nr:alpha/beta hydrolase [Euzebyales bacterium]
MLCNGIGCSTAYWTSLAQWLHDDRPLVEWDYRGHGVSDTPQDLEAATIDDVMADLDAVLRVTGATPAVLVGHSFGVQVVLEAARRWPERVAAIVAIAGSPGTPLPDRATRPTFGVLGMVERWHAYAPDRADEAWRAWWRSRLMHLVARAVGGTNGSVPRAVMQSYYEHVSTRDIGLLLAMVRAMQQHDASDVVPTLDVPLLALAGDADRLTPLPVMTRLALEAPHGELAVRHGGSHTLPAEHPAWVLDQIRPLLARVDAIQRRRGVPAGA